MSSAADDEELPMLGELMPPSCIFIHRRAAPHAAGVMPDATLEERDVGEEAADDGADVGGGRSAGGTKFAGACPTRMCPAGSRPAGKGALAELSELAALPALPPCFLVAPGGNGFEAGGCVAALAAAGMDFGAGAGAADPAAFEVVAIGAMQPPLHPPGGTGAPPVVPCHGAPPVMSTHGETGELVYGGGGGGTICPTLPRGVPGFGAAAAAAARATRRDSINANSSVSVMSAAAISKVQEVKVQETKREWLRLSLQVNGGSAAAKTLPYKVSVPAQITNAKATNNL